MAKNAYMIDGPLNGQRYAIQDGMIEVHICESLGRFRPIPESELGRQPAWIEYVYEKVLSVGGGLGNVPDIDYLFAYNKSRITVHSS